MTSIVEVVYIINIAHNKMYILYLPHKTEP